MEKRAIIAAMLMAALLMIYQMLFMPPPERPVQREQAEQGETPPAATTAGVPGGAAVPPPPVQEAPRPPERKAVVETPLYRAVISSTGGAIETWDIHYRGEKPMVLPGVLASRGLVISRPGQAAVPIAFTLDRDAVKLEKDGRGELTMVGTDGFGLRVTQTMGFSADTYVVSRRIKVENLHSVPQTAEISLAWIAPVEWPKDQESFHGPRPIHAVRLDRNASWAVRESLSGGESYSGDARWVAFESAITPNATNGVYLTALIPDAGGFKVVEARREAAATSGEAKPPASFEIAVTAALPVLGSNQSWDGQVRSYLGPMELSQLAAVGVDLDKAIYFGGFPFPESWAGKVPTFPMAWIAVPILAIMRWFYSFVPNYGVAIILLTVITKVVFFPLTISSMRSMRAMQALQPQINALRSKYKSDPQRLQRETMELYRANKVNPLGGCLPMVVQIPIFYALYVALSVSVEMQNAPFICLGRAPSWMPLVGGQDLWVCDLAAHDPTYILPLLMGASMFVQQKMQPVMGDPRQAKMMLFMPVLFTFMFLNLPSGLVLYWTVSNVLQIAQQKYMDRAAKPAEKVPVRAAKKA